MNAIIKMRRQSLRLRLPLGFTFVLLVVFAAAGLTRSGLSSTTQPAGNGIANGDQSFTAASADTCAAATVISPTSLPFTEDSTLATANNDVDPGQASCAPGGGKDVVY